MLERAPAGKEKALGPDHISTLDTVTSLSNLCADQGERDEAKIVFEQALAGCDKVVGWKHASILSTFDSLGILQHSKTAQPTGSAWR